MVKRLNNTRKVLIKLVISLTESDRRWILDEIASIHTLARTELDDETFLICDKVRTTLPSLERITSAGRENADPRRTV